MGWVWRHTVTGLKLKSPNRSIEPFDSVLIKFGMVRPISTFTGEQGREKELAILSFTK